MLKTLRTVLSVVAIGFLALPAQGGEKPIALKDGPGRDAVEAYCAACHSLDYIQMNSPFLKAPQWQAEVTKMIKTFGAPIPDEDARAIAGYLARNYGG
jgi:mono/diheme cytochrome c family protein